MLYINVIFWKTARSIENFHEMKCIKLFHWKKFFYLYLTIPPQHLQSKGRVFVQTPQCQFFWPSVRALNHFAVRRAALCGQHVFFLTAQRCFDDGWQSSVSGTCLLTAVMGGNISEWHCLSGQIMEWKMPSPCSEVWARMLPVCPSPPTTHTPVGSAKCWQSLCSRGQRVAAGEKREQDRSGEERSRHQLAMATYPPDILAVGRKHCCSLK